METYQIRILKNGRQVTDEACKQASDFAAIRHARALAESSGPVDDWHWDVHVEVWRGSHCLFTGSPAGS